MKAVPASSPDYARASSQIAEYQQQLSIAQQQAIAAPRLPAAIAEASTPDTESQLAGATPGVFIAKIKRRISRTPVIEVTFNGKHTVEMIVDSGASATVITPAMADKIGVRPSDEVMADTASAKRVKFRTGKVESIEAEGAVVTDVQVAIAASHLDTGLLGQDFLSNYDVWIKGDVVEFHSRL
jgi:predicted aspartyl protease